MIYFVQADIIGYIKIGHSSQAKLAKRLVALQTGSPVLLRVLATTPGGRERKQEFHLRFGPHRLHGEWFQPCAELVRLIARLQGKQIAGHEHDREPSPLSRLILACIAPGEVVFPSQVADRLQRPSDSIRKTMHRLLASGRLTRVGSAYRLPDTLSIASSEEVAS